MRNKILVFAKEKERQQIEKALNDFLKSGGELFWAEKKELALQILKKEQPQLVFVDKEFREHIQKKDKMHWVILEERQEKQLESHDSIVKPIRERDVRERCSQVFGVHPEMGMRVPPM